MYYSYTLFLSENRRGNTSNSFYEASLFFFLSQKQREHKEKKQLQTNSRHEHKHHNLNKCLFSLRSFSVFTFYVEVCDLFQVYFHVWCYFLSTPACYFARWAECPQHHTHSSRTALIITLFLIFLSSRPS